MGDHRARIKIFFEIYGVEATLDSSCSYFPDSDGMDPYIRDWFKEKYDLARAKWEAQLGEEQSERTKEREKKARLAQFLELKKEFES